MIDYQTYCQIRHLALEKKLTNRQIAEDMFLAEKTVKNYVTSILDKLGMDSRTQAAVLVKSLEPESLG